MEKKENSIKEYLSIIGRKGGLKTKKLHGKKHYKEMRAKVGKGKKPKVDNSKLD